MEKEYLMKPTQILEELKASIEIAKLLNSEDVLDSALNIMQITTKIDLSTMIFDQVDIDLNEFIFKKCVCCDPGNDRYRSKIEIFQRKFEQLPRMELAKKLSECFDIEDGMIRGLLIKG